MWILECDGNILKGKRVWLRPGKSYLFGRTHLEHGRCSGFKIDDKTVSRKHLTVSVASVPPGQSSKPDVRSALTFEDMATRGGTHINGQKIQGTKKVLTDGSEHTFKLGGFESLFRIKWHPVVLSFTFPSKETKGGKDPLVPIRSRLEDMDIKMLLTYMVDKTTHVVAGKRNTAKGLQALVNGNYIVDNKFLDAIVYATTPGNLDEPESLSPLEEDFDANWPKPIEYLPAPGREPGQREADVFQPDSRRANVFKGYTFVFCDQKQFDTLQPPITNAGGKALFFRVQNDKTSVAEIVDYIRELANQYAGGDLTKVLLIRFNDDWGTRLQQEVQVTLGRELIEQNEFLDAILMRDPTKLSRELPDIENNRGHGMSGTAPASFSLSGGDDPSSAGPSQTTPPKRARTRTTIKSAFAGFDDGFDPSQVIKRSNSASSANRRPLNRRTTPYGQDDAIMEDVEGECTPKASRKRPSPDSEDDLLGEHALPGAAAMKRRRLVQQQDKSRSPSAGATGDKSQRTTTKEQKKPKVQKELDIQAALAEQRKAADQENGDHEKMQEILASMSFADMQALAIVETMAMPEKTGRGPVRVLEERWDSRWNGRKNFKKFRRQGEGTARRGQTVIVPLVEAGKRVGPVASVSSSRRDEGRDGAKQSFHRREREIRDDEESRSRSESYASARSTQRNEEEVPAELQEGAGAETIDVDAPRATRLRDKRNLTEQRMNKRGAPTGSESTKQKRPRITKNVDNSDSEDDMKFRFRRRR